MYRGMDKAALDAAYNNTAAVGIPKRDQYVAGWSARSDAIRKTRGGKIDLRYGGEPIEPARIHLYRVPLIADFGDDPAELADEIRVTVLHEIAHHFGIDDDRLHDLGYA